MRTSLVCGAGGFIGRHLVKMLKKEGFWVRGVDLKHSEFSKSSADEFIIGDLREDKFCKDIINRQFDEVYQLAADMGGAGYIFTGEHDADIMRNSAMINLNVLYYGQKVGIKKIFYSSSACIYPEYNQIDPDNPKCSEDSVYPAAPDSEYGWEKLFSERLFFSYQRNYKMNVKIARFHNVFGPEGPWTGGKEKAPSAICRKVAEAVDGGTIEVWGDGKQTRSFLYIDECLEGVRKLMDSADFNGPVNIGSEEMVTINRLTEMIIRISGKQLRIKHIDGPQGVRGRNSDNNLISKKLGWKPSKPLLYGLEKTYNWIEDQMKLLLISQVYWPDTASVAQHLTDLAEELAKENSNKVKVISSRNNYENPSIRYLKKEIVTSVEIKRLSNSAFGKRNVIGRLIDYSTFNFLLFLNLLFSNKRKYDLIIGLTSPPLVSFIGSLLAKMKGIKFCYWVMDLQPELSISAGYFKKSSIPAGILLRMGNYIFLNSDLIIVLDKYMKKLILERVSIKDDKLRVIPVWPVAMEQFNGDRLANSFRKRYNFADRIVVMYSGNHSVVHPLDTILKTARGLSDNDSFLFVFIGNGVRKNDVTAFKEKYKLDNIMQLPYQKRSDIHISLSSADIHVVILGEKQIGHTHPNKIYGSMYAGKPVIYIGPRPSHITDILDNIPGNISVNHNDVESLTIKLIAFSNMSQKEINEIGKRNQDYVIKKFSPEILKGQLINAINNKFSLN